MSKTVDSRIAVWVQLEPGEQLSGEGIGEHLMRLLKGVRELGEHEVVVCAPKWAGRVLYDMLGQHDLVGKSVTVRLFGGGLARPNRPTFLPRLSTLRTFARRFFPRRDSRPGDPLPMPYARRIVSMPAWGLLLLLGAIVGSLLLPVWLAWRLVKKVARPWVREASRRLFAFREGLTYAQMARFIDNDRSIAGCIVPIANWRYCRYIERKPLAVQIPDVVFMEFPQHFKNDMSALAHMESIRSVARRAGAIVCASDYVKQKHLVRGLGVSPEKVFVVHHAPMRVDQAFKNYCAGRGIRPTKASAITICKEFQAEALEGSEYYRRVAGSAYWLSRARDPHVWDRPKIYVPTQYRPYKNVEQVLHAVAHLRDVHGQKVSVFLTGDLSASSTAFELIEKLDLQDSVVPLPRLPLHVHAAMYVAADLALTASAFEGGLPFVFSEAVSVETPVLMARIPATLELIKGPMLERMTFDPQSTDDLLQKIIRALDDPGLVARQRSLFDQVFGDRGWKDVARGYLDALAYAQTGKLKDQPQSERSLEQKRRLS